MATLKKILLEWNGKHVDYLKSVYHNYGEQPYFIPTILELLHTTSHIQNGITWLLKHHLEQKKQLTPLEIQQLVKAATHLNHWEAQLHFLQILPYITLDTSQVTIVESLIGQLLGSPKKFVKAWAYNGLYELTRYKPDMKADVLILFNAALETEAPSVKARVRNLLKKM